MRTRNNKELSDIEKAVLLYAIAYNITSPAKLYRLANNPEADPSTATRWMQSIKVQDFLSSARADWESRKERERKAIEADLLQRLAAKQKGTVTPEDAGLVDYADTQNQLAKLNELINTSKDPADILDALKIMIATAQKNTEAKDAPARQVRAYLPLNCRDCVLYKREAEMQGKVEKNNKEPKN